MAESEIRAKLVVEPDASSARKAGQQSARYAVEGASKVSGEETKRLVTAIGATTASQASSLSAQARAQILGASTRITLEQSRAIEAMRLKRQDPRFGSSNASALQGFINQSLGIGAGQNRPQSSGYASFWQQATPWAGGSPPIIPPKPVSASGGPWGRMFGQLGTQIPGWARILALITGALASFRVVVGLATWTFRQLIEPLHQFLNWMRQMANEARRYYAGALQGGGPLGFSVHRSNVARALGVGENEVFQYGAALTALNGKFRDSSRQIAAATPRLTMLSWETSALDAQFKALAMSIAAELAPAIGKFLSVIRMIADGLTEFGPYIGRAIKEMMFTGMKVAFGGLVPSVVQEAVRLAVGAVPGQDAAPPPTAWSRRMGTSPWERMGLVLGTLGNNPAQETARNTRRMVSLLERIVGPRGGAVDLHPRLAGQQNTP